MNWFRILLVALVVTLIATMATAEEEVDFYCTSAAAAASSADPLTRAELIDALYCGYFSERYGFVSRGELVHIQDIDGTALAVYRVDYPNGTFAYTVK